MDVDRRIYDRARRSRDARFDGRFFIAVTTTGIYCRPICPARAPKDAHVRYFPTAAAAEAAGFRPCLRCRPEASPGTPAWLGTSGIVSRALRLIGDGALDESGVEAVAVGAALAIERHAAADRVAVAEVRVARGRTSRRLLGEQGPARGDHDNRRQHHQRSRARHETS